MSSVRFVLLLALAIPVHAGAGNFRGTGNFNRQEVFDIFRREVANQHFHLVDFENALRHMFSSLPKNTHGNLGLQTVRYALRRYFMNRYGWLINGIESDSSASGLVPEVILAALESHMGDRGVDLRGLAALTASLEELVEKTSRERLSAAWTTTFGVDKFENISHEEVADTFETYMMMSLSPTTWKIKDRRDLARKKDYFRKNQYSEFRRIIEWYRPIHGRHFGSSDPGELVSFDVMAKVAEEMDRSFHNYFDHDCRAMKETLAGGQGRRAGRVRLAAFYNMSLYGLWSFVEKEGYLRAAGALDDSDPPHVIISNYALGRLNCLNETGLYSVCCRDTCEDLMTHLEQKIQAPAATAEAIASLVAKMPSESVAAPRELPESLLVRLGEVAEHHGGQVPLHGRLFAQWMHHAYPLECPYPHEAGTTNPQSAEQWMAKTGEATHELSVEEVRQQVAADSCVMTWEGTVDCGEDSSELPWSVTEELLAPEALLGTYVSFEYSSYKLSFAIPCLAASLALAWPLVRGSIAAGFSFRFVKKSVDLQNRAVVAVILLAAAAYLADLLDGAIFGIGLVSCSAVLVMRLTAARLGGREALPAPKTV